MTLNKAYDEAMKRIEVTPEMRGRILEHIDQIELRAVRQNRVPHFPRPLAAIAACLVLVLMGALVMPVLLDRSEGPAVTVSNGIVEVNSLEELAEIVGFEVKAPENLPFGVEKTSYTAYWAELAEITCEGGEATATYRKGNGTGDISGDFNLYESEIEIEVDGIAVTLKGRDSLYSLAVWTDGAYSYALSLSEGLPQAAWHALLCENIG